MHVFISVQVTIKLLFLSVHAKCSIQKNCVSVNILCYVTNFTESYFITVHERKQKTFLFFRSKKTELGKMPHRHSPKTLRRYSMLALAKHWDLICYAAHSTKEMNALLESDGYLKYEGPFSDMRKPIHNTTCL